MGRIKNAFNKLFKKDNTIKITLPKVTPMPTTYITNTGTATSTITTATAPYVINTTAAAPYTYTTMAGGGGANLTNIYGNVTGGQLVGTVGGFNGTIGIQYPPDIIKFTNYQGQEIVKMDSEGVVTWANGIDVTEATEAFSRSISLGAELKAGLTERVKRQMRDSVFEDIINIAKEKGSLTAEDLTFLLQSSKIMEKLKGGD